MAKPLTDFPYSNSFNSFLLKYPRTDDSMEELWCVATVEYYWATRNDEIMQLNLLLYGLIWKVSGRVQLEDRQDYFSHMWDRN